MVKKFPQKFPFQIPDKPKICENCSSYLLEFQNFVSKTESVAQMYKELEKESDLNNLEINEFRRKFGLQIIDFEDLKPERFEVKKEVTDGKLREVFEGVPSFNFSFNYSCS